MIGELLLAARAITQAQLDEALLEQDRSGAFLGEVLVSMGAISGDDLARALAAEARVPFAALEEAEADPEAAALIPEDVARRGSSVAVTPRPAGRLLVAQSNPFDVVAIDEIQRHVAMPVDLVCAPARTVARLLDQAYGPGASYRLKALVEAGVASLSRPFDDEGSDVADCAPRRRAHRRRRPAGATDATSSEELSSVRYRIDGVLRQSTRCRDLQPHLVGRLGSWPAWHRGQRLPQRAGSGRRRPVDFRVSRSRPCSARRSPSASSSRNSSCAGSRILD
jgi:type IV pilus assembly protein PilB